MHAVGRHSNQKTALLLGGVVVAMVGMAYAAVPLYELFCRVTGFGGTTQVANIEGVEIPVLDRDMTVRFAANTHRDMPWGFNPVESTQSLKVGEQGLAFYEAYNPTGEPVTGTATFNVTPHKAGEYFVKIECFCFIEQTLRPGQRMDMPVTYFIDPAIADDPNLEEVSEITLSYTFFLTEDQPAQIAGNSITPSITQGYE